MPVRRSAGVAFVRVRINLTQRSQEPSERTFAIPAEQHRLEVILYFDLTTDRSTFPVPSRTTQAFLTQPPRNCVPAHAEPRL